MKFEIKKKKLHQFQLFPALENLATFYEVNNSRKYNEIFVYR